jgi:hypothetical protein
LIGVNGIDFTLQDEVEDGAERDDRSQLADVVPRGGDGGAENVGGYFEFEGKGQPAAETETDGFDFLLKRGRPADEQGACAERGFQRGEADHQGRHRFDATSEIVCPCFQDCEHPELNSNSLEQFA